MPTTRPLTIRHPAVATPTSRLPAHAAAPGPLTAWLYIRESTDAQMSGHSPEMQERSCRALAAARGLVVERVIVESGSARSMRQRKGWQQVHRAIKHHDFDVLVVWKYNRLHRDFFNQLQMLSDARNSGVEILSVEEPLDKESRYGKAMLAFVGIFNEMTSDEIRAQAMAGIRQRVERGMPIVGGKAPYGYRWVEEADTSRLTGATRLRKVRLEPDPCEAPRVVAIFEYMRHPDHSLRLCARWCQEQGWPTPYGRGTNWRGGTIRHLVHHNYYWGEPTAYQFERVAVPVADVHGQVEMEPRDRRRAPERQVALPVDAVPPLVSKELASAVHAKLAARTEHYASHRVKRVEDHLLNGGLLHCGRCGGTMLAQRGRFKRNGTWKEKPTYVCATGRNSTATDTRRHITTIRAEMADRFAVAFLFQMLLDAPAVEAEVRRLVEQSLEHQADAANAAQELADAQRKLDNTKRFVASLDPEDQDEFRAQFKQYQGEVRYWSSRVEAATKAQELADDVAAGMLRAVREARERFEREAQADEDLSLPEWSQRMFDMETPWRPTADDRAQLRDMLFALGGVFVVGASSGERGGSVRAERDRAMSRLGYARDLGQVEEVSRRLEHRLDRRPQGRRSAPDSEQGCTKS